MIARYGVFNYSSGPVQLSPSVVEAMATAGSSSHSPAGQHDVAELISRLQHALAVPADWTVGLLPGSIRQALAAIIPPLVGRRRIGVIRSGYWADFMAGLGRRADGQLIDVDSGDGDVPLLDALLVVHVESEHGALLPFQHVARIVRGRGGVVVVDAACSIPIEPLQWDCADVVVLGSHKCLGGPGGLGIIVVRNDHVRSLIDRGHWAISAYLSDGAHKTEYLRGDRPSPAGTAPLVSYPPQIIHGLATALEERSKLGLTRTAHAEAAERIRTAAGELGFSPHRTQHPASATVVRLNAPVGLDVEAFRNELWQRGQFVIGNIGGSAGGSIRIGTMSTEQVAPANVDCLLEAMRKTIGELASRGRVRVS